VDELRQWILVILTKVGHVVQLSVIRPLHSIQQRRQQSVQQRAGAVRRVVWVVAVAKER
jgi:hypothetical protein